MAITDFLKAAILGVILTLVAPAGEVMAQDPVALQYGDMILNGNLVLAEGQTLSDGVILLTHGTLAHNGMETIQGLQAVLGWNCRKTMW